MPAPRAQDKVWPQFGKLVGDVVRTGTMAKTVLVHLPYYYQHPKYPITVKRRTKLFAHDEFDLCRVGDRVRLAQSRPLSKRKSHVVEAILAREDRSDPIDPLPNVRGLSPDEWPKWRTYWDEKGKVQPADASDDEARTNN